LAFDGLLLATNLLTGALVGYITNSLAIRMLFKEYPVIGGGDVIKNREELEQAMSELVEEQLITPETLLEEFDKEAFKLSFEQLIRYIITHNLKQQLLRFDTPGDLRGYQQTLANLKHFLRQQRAPILHAALNTLFEHVSFEDLLSSGQQELMLNKLWELLLDALAAHSQEISEVLQATLQGLSNEALLPDELLQDLLHHGLDRLDEHILAGGGLDLLDRLEAQLQIPALLQELEAHLRTLTLSELLGEAQTRNIAHDLALRLLDFLNTPQGESLLEDLLRHSIQVLKKLDLSLSLLLSEKLERQLLVLLERYLPPLLELLETWASQNRVELEELVHNAIQDHLRSESVVKHLTATLFTEQISERYRLVENVLEEIKVIASQSMPELIDMTNRFLERTSIGQVISYLESHALDYKALTKTLLRLFNTYLPRLDLSVLDPIFARPLDSFSILKQLHLAPIWQKTVYPYVRTQLQQRLLPHLPGWIRGWALEFWQQLKQRPLSTWLPEADWEQLTQSLISWCRRPLFRHFILQQLLTHLPELVKNRRLEDLLTPEAHAAFRNRLGHVYEQRINQFLDSFQQESIDGLYAQLTEVFFTLAENQQIVAQLREVLVGFMIELIRDHELFHGRIYLTVKESFARFSDQEMQAEMESFMGKELQPITLFGAVLGGGVGVTLSLAAMLPGVAAYLIGLPALFSLPLAYALTGIGTNWLALKMLFRPYVAKHWPFSQRILPFTPGVFVKNKAALADSMSRFIDQKLLSKQNMVDILDRYHQRWKEVIKGVVSANDYAAWDQRFRQAARENYDLLVPHLLDLGFEQIYRHRQDIATALLAEARGLKLNAEDLNLLKSEVLGVLVNSEPYLRRFLNRRLEDWLQHNYPLADQLSPPTLQWLQARLHRLTAQALTASQTLLEDSERTRSLLHSLSLRWEGYLDLQLSQITPGETLPKAQVIRYLLDWISSDALQAEIRELLQRYLGYLLQGDQTLGGLWNGQLLQLVRQESGNLIDILAGYLLEMARQNKERIAKSVVSDVQRQGLLEVMLVNFGGVRQDVYRVVDVVVERNLETYLANKTDGIKSWWLGVVNHKLPQLALSELGLEPELIELETLQQIVRDNVLASPQTFVLLNELADGIVDDLLQQLELKALLQSLRLYSLEDLIQRFELEVDMARGHLARQLHIQQLPIQQDLSQFAQNLLSVQLLDRPPSEWLQQVPSWRLKRQLGLLTSQLYQSPLTETLLPRFLEQVLEPFRAGPVTAWVDYTLLEQDLTRTIEQLTLAQTPRSQAFQETIRLELKAVTIGFVDVLNAHLAQDTKADLENLAVDSLIDGLRINNREVLEPIDFEAIVKRQVLHMNPERIEALFDFARPVFRALIWYGAMGGVIGIIAGMLAALS